MQFISSLLSGRLTAWLVLAGSLAWLGQAQAQPTILSTVPADGATDVSTATTVKFTFSAALVPASTITVFYDPSFSPIPTTPAWSAGNTVLTCTPLASFPANSTITWFVSGAGGIPTGTFTTGAGGGSVGSGTNAITTFTLGKVYSYHQTSTAAPSLDTNAPYEFSAVTSLSSNRTATNITLTLPTGGVSNLTQNFFAHERYSLIGLNTNLGTFDATYPSGTYAFTVRAATSNQTVNVTFPATNVMVQPGAPHVTNYPAAQSVNPALPFVLAWDAFPGGTAADFVYVAVGNVFSSTNAGSPGALPGTATAITIPAGTLQSGSNYDSWIYFYRHVATTNGSSYATTVYRAAATDFNLSTTSGAASGPLVLTNAVFAPANFSFDVLCSTGQTVTVEYRTNLAAGTWKTLLTTNSPGSRFRSVAPQATTNRFLFFRARNGP